MSQTATRPWWADVQHLRPDEDGGVTERQPRAGRFERPTAPSRRPVDGHRAASARVAARAASTEPRRRPHREPEVWLDAPEPAPAPAAPAPAAPASAAAAAAPAESAPKPQRRTIEIRGQVDRIHGVAPVPSPGPQRLRGRRADERVGPRPDKIAMWAVLLGLLLILVAAMSSPGADAAALLPLAL